MMRTFGAVILTVSLSAVWVYAQPSREAHRDDGVRFAAFDVFVDTGDAALGAYQIEISELSGRATIVGVEGGADAAFAAPPYYDPAALHGEGRIILAAFSTADELPAGKARVARLHLRIDGEQAPDFDVQLIVAADADGAELGATATVVATPDDA